MELKSQKTLVVYYSYSGNNKLLAERLAKDLGADIVPIQEKNKRTKFRLAVDVLFKRIPEIEKLPKSIADYDHILFLAPLWNERIAGPLKALMIKERDHIKDYSFVTFCGGYEKKDQMTKVRKELVKLIGHAPALTDELDVSDLFPAAEKKKVTTISRYKVKSNDLNTALKDKLKALTHSLSAWINNSPELSLNTGRK